MATKVKPSRLQISGTPQAGQVPVYVDADSFQWCDSGGCAQWGCITGTLCDQTDLQGALNCKANACDIPTNNNQLANGCGYTTCTGTVVESDLTPYAKTCDLPDFSCYQTKSCMVCNLSSPDDSHYPTSKAVADAMACAGTGDMLKSVYDPNNVQANVYDYCNFMNTPTIPTNNNQLANGCGYTTCTGTLVASDLNPYATCIYVNDAINSVTAYYITKDAQGNQWATYAELAAATTFYSGGVVRVPTRNDYTVVLADETHNNATTRYSYQGSGWQYQYTVHDTPLTQAQLDALNSGITAAKVAQYDGYVYDIADKQDELVSGVNIRTINGTSILGSGDIAIPTGNTQTFVMASSSDTSAAQEAYDWYTAGNNPILSLNGKSYSLYSVSVSLMVFYGGTSNGNGTSYSTLTESLINVELSSGTVTSVSSGTSSITTLSPTVNYGTPFTPTQNGHPTTKQYVDNAVGGIVSDTSFGSSWNGDTTHAPSKNAVYGVLGDVETLLAAL